MRHFPIFLDLRGQRVAVAGGGETAVSKLRLLLKSEARLSVHARSACAQIQRWHEAGLVHWHARPFAHEDAICARLVYCAQDDPVEDARVKAIAEAAGALVNVVDNLEASAFITPAIVDRDPVTVAIGTEGTAPVLARQIKARTEEQLDPQLGTLARIAAGHRAHVEALPPGRARRDFWSRYFDGAGADALNAGGEAAVHAYLEATLRQAVAETGRPRDGKVVLVGAGPGDPELLTLKARRALHEADVVVHDRLVAPSILELARREARLVEVGKMPGGPAWKQSAINDVLVDHARAGQSVVRLKSGDPLLFGRADEEIEALQAAGIDVAIIPGITSAAAAAAALGTSMTRRGRNKAITFLTAQDAKGFAEHDWRALAREDATLAIYMGVRAARFVQGRLMLHGADAARPVSVVENASRPDERLTHGTLGALPDLLRAAGIDGPAIIFIGLQPAQARQAASDPELAHAPVYAAMGD